MAFSCTLLRLHACAAQSSTGLLLLLLQAGGGDDHSVPAGSGGWRGSELQNAVGAAPAAYELEERGKRKKECRDREHRQQHGVCHRAPKHGR
jgi:hypothetical protein